MITLLVQAALVLGPQDYEVPPREVSWQEFENRAYFDTRWSLPERRVGTDLLAQMRRLAELGFRDGDRMRTLGDLVLEAGALSKKDRLAWLERLEERAPRLMSEWRAPLRELLLDDQLSSARWDPSKEYPRDGILTADSWEPAALDSEPWTRVEVSPLFEQGAVLCIADLETIKRVENDYRTYPSHAGADYEEIYPVVGGHLTGRDGSGNPFRFVSMRFRCDLPFPFSDYSCNLRILNRTDEAGVLRTDIYSTSGDFHYLAGRDVFLPVDASNGKRVGYLIVRDFGFDLDDVPDAAKHRREALRSTLGNLKRKAELEAGRRPTASNDAAEVLGGIRVLGRR